MTGAGGVGGAGGRDGAVGATGMRAPVDVEVLATACPAGSVRRGGPDDVIGGVAAAVVAEPASTAEVAALLRRCAAAGLAVVPRGAGTAIDHAAPPSTVDVIVDTRRLSGVYRHAAGDLVAVVGAGTPLREVRQVLATAGQRLCVDPPSDGATVGGILAAGESGPLRLRYGAPRDLLIGAEFVRADGVVARSGGQVVKNVAGYDVGRLLCNSFGTLAILTTVTFRLHPLPPARAFVVCTGVPAPAAVVDAALDSPYVPVAIEMEVTPDGIATVGVLLEGSVDGVAARSAALAALLTGLAGTVTTVDTPPSWWGVHPFGGGDVALRLAVPVARVDAAVAAVRAAAPGAALRGSAGTGVFFANLGPLDASSVATVLDAVRRSAALRDGWCVLAKAPAEVWTGVDGWGPVPGLALMRRIKERFDPGRLLSPGRYVGGL